MAVAGGGEGSVPYDAYLAPIWWQNPCDPREMDEWPMDRVYRMIWYLDAGRKLRQTE